MAIVGEAHIIVRALTTGVERDIQKGFSRLDGVAGKAGKNMGNALTRGLTKGLQKNNAFTRLAGELKKLYPEADKAAKSFTRLTRIGYVTQGAAGALAGSIGTLIGGLGALVGVAGGASVSVVSLGSALASAFAGAKIAGMALKGVAQAASALRKGGGGGGGTDPAEQQKRIDEALKDLARTIEDNQKKIVAGNNKIRSAQLALNEALKEGKEEIQQLGFAAEEAALSESRAAIELEKAREALARTQDLPPNSRARREAELAFKEAEYQYRVAKDNANDLASEQDRLARTGVSGTDVVKNAKQDLADAESDLASTVVDAARDQADAEERLAEALKKVETNAGGAADAMAGLTASQRVFAQYLASDILPKIDELREAVAGKFLPALQTAMDKLFKGGFFETLKSGFELVAVGAGEAVNNFADAIVEPKNAQLLYNFLQQTGELLPKFGSIFGNVWGAALRILDAASGMTERFVSFLEAKSGAFVNFLDTKKATGELDTFFANVERVAGRFGGVFGNIFGGLGDIIMENIGPGSGGDMLLTWLETVSNGFANADSTFLENYFKGAATNMIEMFDTFGVLVNSIVKAGASPEVGEFWNVLGQGATAFDSIVREAVKVAPSLAMLAKNITEVIAAFADSGQAKGFIDTLAFLAGGVAALSKAMKPLMDTIGPAIGVISGVTLAWALLGKGMMVVVGFVTRAVTAIGLITPAAAAASGALGTKAVAAAAAATAEGALAVATTEATVATNLGAIASARAAAASVIAAAGSMSVSVGLSAAGAAAKAFGASVMTAMGPVGWVILGISAAIAGVIAIMAINEQNMNKATDKISKGFEKGADSVDIFKSSLLALPDGAQKANLEGLIAQQGGLNKALEQTSKTADTTSRSFQSYSVAANGYGYAAAQAGAATDKFAGSAATAGQKISTAGLKTSMDAIGQSLGDLAVSELPAAQKAFADFADGQNLSVDAQKQALTMMPEYVTQLEEQAAMLGVNLEGLQGNAREEALLDLARGEGVAKIKEQTEALKEQSIATGDAIASAVEQMQFKDGQLVESEKTYGSYLEEMKAKTIYNAAEIAAQNELIAAGVSATAIEEAAAAGVSIQDMRDTVIAGGDPMIAEVNRTTSAAMSLYNSAVSQMGVDGMDAVEAGAKAAYDANIINLDEFLAVTKTSIEGYTPTQTIKPDTKEWNDLQTKLTGYIPKNLATNVSISGSLVSLTGWDRYKLLKKDGGFIKGFADGGVIKGYAGGGSVFGAGGPRADRVPAMLSAGEYVVNAMATKRFKPLLEAINNGSPISANGGATMGSGAPNINITVNPSPGMDERELASAVSREISFQMRKGAVA